MFYVSSTITDDTTKNDKVADYTIQNHKAKTKTQMSYEYGE